MSRAVLYHCPTCENPGEGTNCKSCGYQATDGEDTWFVAGATSDQLPAQTPTRGAGDGEVNVFQGRYEILEQIGRGGMGIVYRAFDRELDEVIALKTLVEAIEHDPGLVQRFKHELKVARKLSHPNIARFHDLVEVNGKLFLSMEFIAGESLREKLAHGPITPDAVTHYLKELLPAIDLAHRHGVVHRDLKPGNIIVDNDNLPHVLDFGIATSRWTEVGADTPIAGTPTYMAPEQWMEGQKGVTVDGRADLYSLGVMCYEMLCGAPPFQHRNRYMLMEMHRTRAPRRPRSINPAVTPLLDDVVLRLLEKQPDKRFARARDVLQALMPDKPRATASATPQPAANVDQPKGSVPPVKLMPGVKGKVLVAEGDPELRATLVNHMRGLNLIVVEAENGQQAVERCFREIPDLVIIDVKMTILDGLDVLRLIKHDSRTKNVPVVMMSENMDDAHAAFARDLGAATFLDMPIQTSVLELLIERYIGATVTA